MIATRSIENEIQAQKQVIHRLKREIFGIDKSSRSSYIRDFTLEFNRYERVVGVERLFDRAARCDVVYFGDYHPLDASQEWLIRLMKELVKRERKVVLAMEMLYGHHQESLDRWMKGMIPEDEFLAAIDYPSEWGFSWESFRRIFDFARDPFIPIFGIDSEPRDHLRYIRARDRMIARRLRNIREFFPDHVLLVCIGESHLASNHLPAEFRKISDSDVNELVIVQNIDEIYWSLLRKGKSEARAVRVDEGRYCVFSASPVVKYMSYRKIIDVWIEGERCDLQTPALRDMVNNVLYFLVGDTGKIEVTVRGDWKTTIDTVFPEVQCRRTYHAFATYLRSRRISDLGVIAARECLKNHGVLYVSSINVFLVARFTPMAAAREAARFVLYALGDGIGMKKRMRRGVEDRFYAFVLEEACSYFGSKIIDPTQDCLKTDPLLCTIDARGVVRNPLMRFTLRVTREIVRHLKYHFERERAAGSRLKSTRKLKDIHTLPIRKRFPVIKTLGSTLGEAMYRGVHSGLVGRSEMLKLFRERFDGAGTAKRVYIEWVRKTKPFRGGWGKRGNHINVI